MSDTISVCARSISAAVATNYRRSQAPKVSRSVAFVGDTNATITSVAPVVAESHVVLTRIPARWSRNVAFHCAVDGRASRGKGPTAATTPRRSVSSVITTDGGHDLSSASRGWTTARAVGRSGTRSSGGSPTVP